MGFVGVFLYSGAIWSRTLASDSMPCLRLFGLRFWLGSILRVMYVAMYVREQTVKMALRVICVQDRA